MLMVSSAPAQDRAVDAAVRAAASSARRITPSASTRDALAARVRSPVFRRGVFFRECATVQPARLVRALRRARRRGGRAARADAATALRMERS